MPRGCSGATPMRSRSAAFPREPSGPTERQDRIIRNFAKYCEKPVINLESVRRHPCQGLADALTLQEKLGEPRGKKFVLQWAWHPKPLPTAVPVSAALAAAHLGHGHRPSRIRLATSWTPTTSGPDRPLAMRRDGRFGAHADRAAKRSPAPTRCT